MRALGFGCRERDSKKQMASCIILQGSSVAWMRAWLMSACTTECDDSQRSAAATENVTEIMQEEPVDAQGHS